MIKRSSMHFFQERERRQYSWQRGEQQNGNVIGAYGSSGEVGNEGGTKMSNPLRPITGSVEPLKGFRRQNDSFRICVLGTPQSCSWRMDWRRKVETKREIFQWLKR